MSSIKKWNDKIVSLRPGELYIHNLMVETANILQITNRKASGGGTIFVDTESSVSPQSFIMSVQPGNAQMLVRPHVLKTVYLQNNATDSLQITLTEIESDELSFAYNSAQVVDVQGSVQVQEPITIDGTVNVSGEVEVKNDSGNPIPVSGAVAVNNFPASQDVRNTTSEAKIDQLIQLMIDNNAKLDQLIAKP